MADPVVHASNRPLDYHRPITAADRLVALLRMEPLAIAVALSGFSTGYFFGRPTDRHDVIAFILGLAGLIMLFGGTVWYVLLRVRSRLEMPFLLRVQLFAATLMCLVGVFATVSIADQEREGPRGMQYWVTYNQTYGYNPVRAIQAGWTTGAGLLWFVMVLAAARVLKRRSGGCARQR